MLLYKNRIIVTGGSGRFGKIIKENEHKFKYNFLFPNKKNLNILNLKSIKKYLSNKNQNI